MKYEHEKCVQKIRMERIIWGTSVDERMLKNYVK